MLAPPMPEIGTAMMIQQWRQLTFLHWRYPVDAVRPLLPAELTPHTIDGDVWVGLIPFLMCEVRPPGIPELPWLSRFPETNLRTYVTGPDGGTGIWFFSLDAARLPAVAAARAGLNLPYRWARMSLRDDGDTMTYRGVRRYEPRGAGYRISVRRGAEHAETELSPLDHFLTTRHRLYTVKLGRLVTVDVWHPPWPLHRAEVVDLREDLTVAAGLPRPHGAPLVHWSPGVRTRIGMPRILR
ncbi:YqjF family protein [Actinoplanes sp. GCM10030250]|uniref:YqjF family protein n=1 Tax=Actinoplanes sp. GCM10030250 TaxID=3273376 RepID=UPI003617DBA9